MRMRIATNKRMILGYWRKLFFPLVLIVFFISFFLLLLFDEEESSIWFVEGRD